MVCYNIGTVTGSSYVGGVSGYDGSSTTYSYYDSDVVTTSNSYGTPLTREQMTVITDGVAPEAMKGFYETEWIFTVGELPKLRMEDYTYGITEQPTLQEPNSSNSESNPYIIDTEAKLAYLSENSSWAANKYFLQTADLDFSSYEYFIPINNSVSNYAYYYDGGNHTISNITIEISNKYVGLFGRVYGSSSNRAYIRNVHLVNSSIGGLNYVGSIVGYGSYVDITNCSNNGAKVVGTVNIAGIAAYLTNATVINCSNSADIISTYSSGGNIGGLIGFFSGNNIKIIGSYNSGDISVITGNVGGIVGRVSLEDKITINIKNCYNTGDLISQSSVVGGICGDIYSYNHESVTIDIINCYNAGDLIGHNTMGGIVGNLELSGTDDNNFNINICNCYNTGNISGYDEIGGIVGELRLTGNSNKANISNCYNTGNISGYDDIGGIVGHISHSSSTTTPNIITISSCFNIGEISGERYNICGVIGYNPYHEQYVSIAWCYYNTETSGVTRAISNGNGYQCYGLTTSQMQGLQSDNYMYLSSTYWNFADGQYPTLKYVAKPAQT